MEGHDIQNQTSPDFRFPEVGISVPFITNRDLPHGYSHISYVLDMCCREERVFNNFNSRLSGSGYGSQIVFI